MSTDPLLFLAESRQRELQAAARQGALARLAACCSPSRLGAALRSAKAAFRRDHATASCCA